METIPLFPLSDVLFPGMMLPLHIFEPRYRIMIKRCVDGQLPFGVVLISQGSEVGSGAEFFPVGTTARITRVQQIEDGRMLIATVGERRFRVLQTIEDEPYLQGQVEMIPEKPGAGEELASLSSEGLRLLAQYLTLFTGSSELGENLSDKDFSPQRLSYTIGSILQVNRQQKQSILEMATTSSRLKHEVELLENEIRQLKLLGQSQTQDVASAPAFWSTN